MAKNTGLKWRNAALKYLVIGPGETAIHFAIKSLLDRASGRTNGLTLSDLWAKGTKCRSRPGEVDPEVTRFIVTWGGRVVITIFHDGSVNIETDDQLERLPGDGTLSPSASSSQTSFVFKPLESELVRSSAAGAFDEKQVVKEKFKEVRPSGKKPNRL